MNQKRLVEIEAIVEAYLRELQCQTRILPQEVVPVIAIIRRAVQAGFDLALKPMPKEAVVSGLAFRGMSVIRNSGYAASNYGMEAVSFAPSEEGILRAQSEKQKRLRSIEEKGDEIFEKVSDKGSVGVCVTSDDSIDYDKLK